MGRVRESTGKKEKANEEEEAIAFGHICHLGRHWVKTDPELTFSAFIHAADIDLLYARHSARCWGPSSEPTKPC